VLGELKRIGYMTTPVIIIGGSIIVGFDAEKIDQALQARVPSTDSHEP
jgi:hypothetical protein